MTKHGMKLVKVWSAICSSKTPAVVLNLPYACHL